MNEQTRLGITGSLQFQPSSSTLFSLDVLYADLSGTREEQFLESPSFSAGGAAGLLDTNVVDASIRTTGPTSTLDYGVFNDVDIRSEARFDSLTTEFTQVTLDGAHDFENGLQGARARRHGRVEPRQSEADDPAVRLEQHRWLYL